jgi:mono/diheme cytochrome c family protein
MKSSRGGRRIVAVLLALILVACAAQFAEILFRGVSARDEPTRIETVIARTFRHVAIPATWRNLANPVGQSEEVVGRGLRHFADHCATCHGNDGRGNTTLGRRMYPPAPDMTLDATQKLSDGELYAIIQNGVRLTGMPAFGEGRTDDEETWSLVHFIRHLPEISGEEIVLMNSLNRKTPAELEAEAEEDAFLSGEVSAEPAPAGAAEHHH